MCCWKGYEAHVGVSCSDAHVSSEPLDEMSQLVSKLFSPIVNKQLDPLPMIHDHPFGPNEMGVSGIRLVYIHPTH